MFKHFLGIGLIVFSLIAHTEPANGPLKTAAASSKLKKDDLLNILAAEFSIQRNQYGQALVFYMDQAKLHQNVYLAERATELALHQKKYPDMLDAALIWQKNDPDNEMAHFFVSLAYAFNMQPNVALENMRKVLLLKGETDFTRLVNVIPQGSPAEDFYLQELIQASKLYPENYDVSLALALLYQRQGNQELALEYSDKTVKYAGNNTAAIEYAIRLYNKYNQTAKALDTYRASIAKNPDNLELRQHYAQYAIQHDLEAAKEQFLYLHQLQPNDDYAMLSLGLIYLEQGDMANAEAQFIALKESKQRLSAANFYLGEIYKYQKNFTKALSAYSAVNDRDQTERVREQIISIYIEQKRYDEALTLIDRGLAQSKHDEHTEHLHVLKAAVLEKQGQVKEAYQLLTQLLDHNPDSFDLRYSRAMLSETKNELTQMESDLRHIIQLYPDSALALNALGYTLADKTDRYREALELIEQAQKLVPDDPAILDSLGWVLFRMGRLSESVNYLKHALKLFPDTEVAAHLGEALWVSGQKEDAKKVFRDALQTAPDDSLLQETIKRLDIGL
jgi:tetratricopeptide (TPR) repeat protein